MLSNVVTRSNKIGSTIAIRILQILVYVLIPALITAVAVFRDSNVILGLLLIPTIAAVIFRLPYTAVTVTAVSIVLVEALYFNLRILPRQITWLSDIAILLFVMRVFVLDKPKLTHTRHYFRTPILVFSILFLCSALLNAVSLPVVLVSVRAYFKYVMLYLAITRLPMTQKTISSSLRFFFLLVLIQVPIVVVCYLLGAREDSLSGGLGVGGTAPLGFLCLAAANVFVSAYVHRGRLSDLLKFLAVAIVPAISEIKFGIILFPISIMIVIGMGSRINKKRACLVMLILAPIVLAAVITYKSTYPTSFEKLLTQEYWKEYVNREMEVEGAPSGLSLGRMAQLRISASRTTENLTTALIGLGPGETRDSFFEAGKGSLYSTILGAASGVQFTQVLLELGIPGVIMLLWLMVRLPKGLARLYRTTSSIDDKALICGLFGTSVIMVVYVFYMPVLFYADPTAYLFWISAAFLSVSLTEIRQRSTN